MRVNSSIVDTNVTYSVTGDDSENVTLGLPEWETIVVGTKQVRHMRYIDRMNVLGVYILVSEEWHQMFCGSRD